MADIRPPRLFISYLHEDEAFRQRLETYLKPLQVHGVLESWDDRRIGAGEEWAEAIDNNLNAADIILLLISPDFLASDYCRDKEVKRAMERHEAGEACLIPVILRTCYWKREVFGRLQGVPREAKPIARWEDRDEASLVASFCRWPAAPATGTFGALPSGTTARRQTFRWQLQAATGKPAWAATEHDSPAPPAGASTAALPSAGRLRGTVFFSLTKEL